MPAFAVAPRGAEQRDAAAGEAVLGSEYRALVTVSLFSLRAWMRVVDDR
jgi:hypothetical protein